MYTRSEWARDPRAADLPNDTMRWNAILAMAYDTEPQPAELFGALHGARCIGATIERDEQGGWRISPPLDPDDRAGYTLARAVFIGHRAAITRMLSRIR